MWHVLLLMKITNKINKYSTYAVTQSIVKQLLLASRIHIIYYYNQIIMQKHVLTGH